MKIPLAHDAAANEMRKRHLKNLGPRAKFMSKFGTCGLFGISVETDNAPAKNWGGVAVIDFLGIKN